MEIAQIAIWKCAATFSGGQLHELTEYQISLGNSANNLKIPKRMKAQRSSQ
jgi:hypothetical protein